MSYVGVRNWLMADFVCKLNAGCLPEGVIAQSWCVQAHTQLARQSVKHPAGLRGTVRHFRLVGGICIGARVWLCLVGSIIPHGHRSARCDFGTILDARQ